MIEEKQWISSEILFTAIKEQLAAGRQAAFTVTGMSMWPFLCHGRDQVIVKACGEETPCRGDIVLLQTGAGNYLLHRVTRLTENGFVTTGDGNLFCDGEFPYEDLWAKVVRVIRKGCTIECSDWRWKTLSKLWMGLYPVRKGLFFLWFRILRKIVRR